MGYQSNFIRLYIDGVEITQGWMGSGLILYGDVNIDFVDHIEFYYMIPSFDTSVEPAYLTVFLYSKSPKQDSGAEVSLMQSAKDDYTRSFNYGEEKENFSYMFNASHTDRQRETINNGTNRPLSRNFERTQLFGYIKDEKQIFHVQVMKKEMQSLAGMSFDATPLESTLDYLNLHLDYGIDFNDYWRLQVAYDWLKTDMRQLDELPLAWADALGSNQFYGIYQNSTYSAELTYKETIGAHRLTAGVKARRKKLDSLTRDGKEVTLSAFNSEGIRTVFVQDQYLLSEKELLTLGISYNHIIRNGGIDDDALLQLRLGYIYTDDYWSYKTYLYRTQFTLEPLRRYLNLATSLDVPIQTTLGITQEIDYRTEKHRLNLMFLMMKDENGLLANSMVGALDNTKYFFTVLGYDYIFNANNKINAQFYYANYQDIFKFKKFTDRGGYLSFINSYNSFDFYNGVVWHTNSLDEKNYFDMTTSISWNINANLSLTIKGENLLNRAKATTLSRFDLLTQIPLSSLEISPIDQRILLEMEYLF